MFKADIGPATVVTLYVLPDFMEKLRPKLLSELKPGSRIVAHDYYMSGWYPDQQLTLTVPEKVTANGTDKAYLYLWIVPSVVPATGAWISMSARQTGIDRSLVQPAISDAQCRRSGGRAARSRSTMPCSKAMRSISPSPSDRPIIDLPAESRATEWKGLPSPAHGGNADAVARHKIAAG